MWKVVYIAQTAEAAARIKEVLAANGFLTQTKLRIPSTVAYMKSVCRFPKLKMRMRSFAKTSFSCNSKEAGQ